MLDSIKYKRCFDFCSPIAVKISYEKNKCFEMSG